MGKKSRKSPKRERKTCEGKVRYANGSAAEAAALKHGQYIYPCVPCGGWHLTSLAA